MFGLFKNKKRTPIVQPQSQPQPVQPQQPAVSAQPVSAQPAPALKKPAAPVQPAAKAAKVFLYTDGIENHSEYDFRKDYEKYFSKNGMDRQMYNLIHQLFDPSFIEALNSSKAAKEAMEALGDAADKEALAKITATVDSMEKSIEEKKKILYADTPAGAEVKEWFDKFGIKEHLNQLGEKYGYRVSSIYEQNGNHYINLFCTSDVHPLKEKHGWYFKFTINVGSGNKITDILFPTCTILGAAQEYRPDVANDNVAVRMDREICHIVSFPEWLVRMRCDDESLIKNLADSCITVIDKNKDCHVIYEREDMTEFEKSNHYKRTGEAALDVFMVPSAEHFAKDIQDYLTIEAQKRNSYADYGK